jgi:predicted GIY-YIG superfamily endonuclease
MRTYFIYALGDPRDGAVRYVGCTINPVSRFRDHVAASYDTSTYAWCRELRALGMKPVLLCLQTTDNYENAGRLEVGMMTTLRQEGHRLLNRNRAAYRDTTKANRRFNHFVKS